MKAKSRQTPIVRPLGGDRFFCPVALPAFRFQKNTDAFSKIKQAVYATRAKSPLLHRLRVARYQLTWPGLARQLARKACAIWGNAAVEQGGVPLEQQVKQLAQESIANNLSFVSYFAFQLWRAERLADSGEYLQDFEGNWLNDLLFAGQNRDEIDDKLQFAHFCARHGLTSGPVILSFGTNGEHRWEPGQQRLPQVDLFVKSRNLYAGKLAQLWQSSEQPETWQNGDEVCDEKSLFAHWQQLAKSGALVIQSRLRSHETHRDLNPEAIGTLRCMTYRRKQGNADVFRASMRFPRIGMITDHGSSGAIAAAVETDGLMRLAESRSIEAGMSRHPDWHTPIEGEKLPGYTGMVELARRAHDASRLVGFIGWDMAMTEMGPTLIEGNTNAGFEFIQSSWNEPLGRTDFSDIVAQLMTDRGLPLG